MTSATCSQEGHGNYLEKVRTMMNQKAPRLVVDLNDLREYDSAFQDARGQDNIVNRCVWGECAGLKGRAGANARRQADAEPS